MSLWRYRGGVAVSSLLLKFFKIHFHPFLHYEDAFIKIFLNFYARQSMEHAFFLFFMCSTGTVCKSNHLLLTIVFKYTSTQLCDKPCLLTLSSNNNYREKSISFSHGSVGTLPCTYILVPYKSVNT
jgi:hypothetical protein